MTIAAGAAAAIGAAALCLNGCASTPTDWHRPAATRADLDRDRAACEYEATAATATYGSSQPTARTLGGAIGQGIGIGFGRAMEYQRLGILCMRAKGWRPNSEPAASYAQPETAAGHGISTPHRQPADGMPALESKYLFAAQDWARGAGCSQPIATLSARGAGFEIFTVRCGAADPIAVRCDYGTCRGLF